MKQIVKSIRNFFDREELNTGRQGAADVAKTVCLFFMVLVHLTDEVAERFRYSQGTFMWFVNAFLLPLFGASVFMFCMGIGFGYSKKSTPKQFINRGVKVFILAYVLDIVRTLPLFIDKLSSPKINWEKMMQGCLEVDIMQFAGLAMIVFGVMGLLRIRPVLMLLIGFLSLVAANLIPKFSTGIGFFDLILGAIIPNQYLDGSKGIWSCFPLLSYLIFPMAGYCFSLVLKRIKKLNGFYLVWGLIGAAITVVFVLTCSSKEGEILSATDESYYHMAIISGIALVFSAAFFLAVCHFISLVFPKFLNTLFQRISGAINSVYCIHWVLITCLTVILWRCGLPKDEPWIFSQVSLVLTGVGIFVISAAVAVAYSHFKKRVLLRRRSEQS